MANTMIRFATASAVLLFAASLTRGADPAVTDIRALHRDGQTFVTWTDAAEGEAGAKFRYSLYRSEEPITADNLKDAELCYHGVFNNSARLFGTAFTAKDRIDPKKPTATIEVGGKPLPMWSGLAVRTVRNAGNAYYPYFPDDLQLSARHVRRNPGIPSVSASFLPK